MIIISGIIDKVDQVLFDKIKNILKEKDIDISKKKDSGTYSHKEGISILKLTVAKIPYEYERSDIENNKLKLKLKFDTNKKTKEQIQKMIQDDLKKSGWDGTVDWD